MSQPVRDSLRRFSMPSRTRLTPSSARHVEASLAPDGRWLRCLRNSRGSRVHGHPNAAAVHGEVVSIRVAHRSRRVPLNIGCHRPDGLAVHAHLHRPGRQDGVHRGVLWPVQGHPDDAAVDADGDNAARGRQSAGDIAGAAVQLDPADAETAQIEHRVPGPAVDLEVPRVVGAQLNGAVIAAAAILDEHKAARTNLHRCRSAPTDRGREVDRAGCARRGPAHAMSPS